MVHLEVGVAGAADDMVRVMVDLVQRLLLLLAEQRARPAGERKTDHAPPSLIHEIFTRERGADTAAVVLKRGC